jgi:hypothetical protein
MLGTLDVDDEGDTSEGFIGGRGMSYLLSELPLDPARAGENEPLLAIERDREVVSPAEGLRSPSAVSVQPKSTRSSASIRPPEDLNRPEHRQRCCWAQSRGNVVAS